MIDTRIVEQNAAKPVVALDCRERGVHAREVRKVALVVRPVAGALRTDIDADGKIPRLRQTTAGCLADQAICCR